MIHSTRFRNANDVKEFVDCLPRELGDRIYKLAGILTQFLHGQLPQPIDEPVLRCVVAECFARDAVELIPAIAAANPAAQDRPNRLNLQLTWESLFIRSEEMEALAAISFGRLSLGQKSTPPMRTERQATALDLLPCWRLQGNALDQFQDWLQQPEGLSHIELVTAHRLLESLASQICRLDHHDMYPRTCDSEQANQLCVPRTSLCNALAICAASLGRIDIILIALQRRSASTIKQAVIKQIWDSAAVNGHANVLQFISDSSSLSLFGHHQGPWFRDLISIDSAIQGGNTDCIYHTLSILGNNVCVLDPFSIDIALSMGHTDAIETFIKSRTDSWSSPGFDTFQDLCAKHGKLDLLQFAVDNHIGEPMSTDAIDAAAIHGGQHLVERLCEMSAEWGSAKRCTVNALLGVSRNGNLETLKYLIKCLEGEQMDDICKISMIKAAATYGHFETFEYLIHKFRDTNVTLKDLHLSARFGHFKVLEHYLISKANHGRTLGCCEDAPGYPVVIKEALAGGHLRLAQWLLQVSGISLASIPMKLLLGAIVDGSGNVACAQWVFGAGNAAKMTAICWDQLLCAACQNGHLALVAFLAETCGVIITSKACILAASRNQVQICLYLLKHSMTNQTSAHSPLTAEQDYGRTMWDAAIKAAHQEGHWRLAAQLRGLVT